MDGSTALQADDSATVSPPLPVIVGDIVYVYRMDPNYDRELDEIDWENLLFDEPDEFDPELHAYDSRNYSTEEEADAALARLLSEWTEEACREAASACQPDEPR